MLCRLRIALISLALHSSSAVAQISLYIPDTDPQPLSAEELGVGADGQTTWLLQPGEATGSWATEDNSFPTLTLIEGPNDAVMTGDPELSFAVSCTLVNGLAACTNLAVGGPGWTELPTLMEVQGGGTAVPAPSTQNPGSVSVTASAASASATRPISPNGSPLTGSGVIPTSTATPLGSGAVRVSQVHMILYSGTILLGVVLGGVFLVG